MVLSRSLPPFSLPGLSPFSLSGHSGAVCCVSADFQRKWAVSGSDDGTLRLWCLGEGPEEGRLNIYDYCGDYCSLIIRIILGFIPLSWKCPLLICWLVRSFGIHKGPTSPSMFDLRVDPTWLSGGWQPWQNLIYHWENRQLLRVNICIYTRS